MAKKCRKYGVPLGGVGIRPSPKEPGLCNKCDAPESKEKSSCSCCAAKR